MIKTGFKYRAYSPKKTKSGKTMFSVMDYDKANPNGAKRYCMVFCVNEIEVYDKQSVIIKEIQSISLGEYQGKLQVSMFAIIEPDGEAVDEHLKKLAGDKPAFDKNSDLPF